ncbi:MAG: helix-turn-helix domain-containing protein [Castellaniella sp.]
MNQTFDRGLQILETIRAAGKGGLSMAAIAHHTGIQRSTVYRYVDVLRARGYVQSLNKPSMVAAAPSVQKMNSDSRAIHHMAHALRRISDATGDSSFLVRADNGDSLCLHRELGSYPVQVLAVTIGYRQPLGVGAAGLALLANQTDDTITAILADNADRLPRFGGMTRARMEQLILTTRERGWSAVGNAAVPGVLGVGLPVACENGPAQYAVSVSSIMTRMPLSRQRFIIDVMRRELAPAKPFASPDDSR